MNPCDELFQAYDQWRSWTENEGEAIRLADWSQVGHCQSVKHQLQSDIIHLTDAAQVESKRQGSDWTEIVGRLRAVVRELIMLETRNSNWLTSQRQNVEAQNNELGQARHNLRQVRKSYVPARFAVWESYS